jgi:hypothetical protein
MTTTVINGTFKTQDIQDTDETTAMNIATASRTSSLNIGTGGINGVLGTNQGINIGSGTNNAYSFMSLGSDTLAASYIRSANIQMNTNNSGETNIGWVNGATNGTTNVYGNLYARGNLRTNAIRGETIGTSPTYSIYANSESTTSNINIGSGSQILIDGALKVSAVNGYSDGGAISIGGLLSAVGSLALGSSTCGATSLESGVTTTIKGATTNINTTAGTTNIGNSGTNTTVNGTLKTNTIESTATSTTMNIGTTSRTAPLNIGTGGINGIVGVTQGINIGSGTNNAYSFMSLGSDTMANNYIRGTNIEMNTNNSGNTNIGWRNTGAGTYGLTNFYGGITSLGETIKNTIVGIGGNVKFTLGNAGNETGQSITFCRKNTSSLATQNCFSITMVVPYSSAVFEITIGGANQGSGGYSYKGGFNITGGGTGGATPSISGFTSFLVGGTGITLGSTTSGSTVTITANNPGGTNQCFCATLIQYASVDINNGGNGFSVTAV